MDRKDWLEARRKGIGASDAASIMGYGYGSPLKVWLSKVHPEMLEEEDDKELLEFGLDVEPAIARAYSRSTGRKLIDLADHEIVRHPQYPEIFCTPDLLTAENPRRLVQLKWESRYAEKFGDPGTDQVPDAYLIQCAHEMAVVGCDFEDIATMHAGPPVLIYPLRRDPEIEKVVIDACRSFWADYVITKKEPPIDASKDWASYIEKRWPDNRGEIRKVELETDQLIYTAAVSLEESIRQVNEYKDRSETLKNVLKQFIGDADGIEGDFGRITWRKAKDTKQDVTDWRLIANDIRVDYSVPDEKMTSLFEKHTQRDVIVKKGSRRFMTKFK